MPNPNELKTLTGAALDAFWAVVASRLPEARTGNLSPGATIRLHLAAEEAVAGWIANNVPASRIAAQNEGGRHE